METIGIKDMKQVVKDIAWGMKLPTMFWGGFGVGKSRGVQQAAADNHPVPAWLAEQVPGIEDRWNMAGELVDIRLSQYDSVDLRGIPVPGDDGLTTWHAPSTLPFKGNSRFTDDHPIFLFLDEINSASPAVAAVAYQLVLEGRVGEHVLLPNVVVIAAGNRDQDKGVTNKMPMPLANRLIHFEVASSPREWCDWALEEGLDPTGVAFIEYLPSKLNTYDPANTGQKAVASSRTWEAALRIWSNKELSESIRRASVTGAIGSGVAAEFFGFCDLFGELVQVEDVVKDPMGTPIVKELSKQYATIVHLVNHLDEKNMSAVSKYANRMTAEFQILYWKMAKRIFPPVVDTDEFLTFIENPTNFKIITA